MPEVDGLVAWRVAVVTVVEAVEPGVVWVAALGPRGLSGVAAPLRRRC